MGNKTVSFFKECLVLLATNLHTSMVMYSNWPIADGYISSFNVPANPSSVPKTGTTHSGKLLRCIKANNCFLGAFY